MLQTSIQSALQAIPHADFRSAHLDLLATLGYKSDKTIPIAGAKPKAAAGCMQSKGFAEPPYAGDLYSRKPGG